MRNRRRVRTPCCQRANARVTDHATSAKVLGVGCSLAGRAACRKRWPHRALLLRNGRGDGEHGRVAAYLSELGIGVKRRGVRQDADGGGAPVSVWVAFSAATLA